ncbi:MAG: LysR family transcriptional regulator [Pseudomonadota bacterium]
MRTALLVGRLGTVKAAAQAMQVHRATVSRHIDTLERGLDTKLFIRHKDGYSLTEHGAEMMDVAEKAESLFSAFAANLVAQDGRLQGRLRISALSRAAAILAPAISSFAARYPRVQITYDAIVDVAKLERGHAHIAVRAGDKPHNPDYVVVPFRDFAIGLYAHKRYLDEKGVPTRFEDLASHRFIGRQKKDATGALEQQVWKHLGPDGLALETGDPTVVLHHVQAGLGLGLVSALDAEPMSDLVEVLTQASQHTGSLWIVSHIDVYQTPIMKEFVSHLRQFSDPLT